MARLVAGIALAAWVKRRKVCGGMPVFMLVLASILWALSFPLVKALHLEQAARLPDASTLFLASWMQVARFGLAALMLLPFVWRGNRPRPIEVRQGLVLAFWGGAGMWAQTDALAHTEASTAAFLTQAYCIILPLWACARLRKWPSTRVVCATLMVLAGGAVLSGIRPGHFKLGRGELEILLAAFLFTFQILALENPRYANNRGLPVSFVMFLVIAVAFVPVTAITSPDLASCLAAGASLQAVVLMATLALFCTVGAYLLMNIWQPFVSAVEAGLIYTIEPVFSAGFVLFLPAILSRFIGGGYVNEVLSSSMVIGGTLILAATVLAQWRRPPHLPPSGPVS